MPHKDREQSNEYWRNYRQRKLAEGDSDYIEKSRARFRRAAKVRRERIRQMILDAKNKPCVDCGNSYPPEIMDLDHVSGNKEFNLAKASRGVEGYKSYDIIAAEIAKCVPRCPTCHRLRHHHENLREPGTESDRAA